MWHEINNTQRFELHWIIIYDLNSTGMISSGKVLNLRTRKRFGLPSRCGIGSGRDGATEYVQCALVSSLSQGWRFCWSPFLFLHLLFPYYDGCARQFQTGPLTTLVYLVTVLNSSALLNLLLIQIVISIKYLLID